MKVSIHHFDTVTVLSLNGRFDTFTVSDMETVFSRIIAAKNPPFLLLNMGQVSFLDSAALALLVRVLKRCAERSGKLGLIHVHATVGQIFRVTNLDRVFPIYQSEQEALVNIMEPDRVRI